MEELGTEETLGSKFIVSLGKTPSGWKTFPRSSVFKAAIMRTYYVKKNWSGR